MKAKRGKSIFWLGLLGFILFPLGIIAIVLGCIQLKHKTASGWTRAGLALGITSTTLALAMIALIISLFELFSPPYEAVPLSAPIPTVKVQPPFETPREFVTGYNQLMQEVSEKGGFGLVDFKISSYFDASDVILKEMQRDLDSYHKLFLVISNKLGAKEAKEFEKSEGIVAEQLPYIRPQTLKQKADHSYDAINTDGNIVLLTYTKGVGWKSKTYDGLGFGMFKTVIKPFSRIIDSITQRVEDGELKTVKSIQSAILKEVENIDSTQ